MNVSLDEYLLPGAWVNSDDAAIRSCAFALTKDLINECTKAERLYRLVRDEIKHSWDAQRTEMNGTASEVLAGGHGICYGKSHLLAALLRAVGIPAGITYQRLTLFDNPEGGYAIHALNTVYFRDLDRWIRLDARGNKPGVEARFSLGEEQLAFAVRPEYGERDYRVNHATPHPAIARTFELNTDCLEMYRNGLPTDLEYPC
jgi:transglutaminase-like putative cysteine protease